MAGSLGTERKLIIEWHLTPIMLIEHCCGVIGVIGEIGKRTMPGLSLNFKADRIAIIGNRLKGDRHRSTPGNLSARFLGKGWFYALFGSKSTQLQKQKNSQGGKKSGGCSRHKKIRDPEWDTPSRQPGR